MLVVRPAASSGTNGSGLELKYVDYNSKRVLFQAHAPIWNVLYDNPDNTQFRDWTTNEAGFDATGTPFKDSNGNDMNGFLICSAPPKTVFETGQEGSFYGVAFNENPDSSWTLSTMMQAGWYRYYMAYTFFPDGTIKPRIGFTSYGFNPHAGDEHHHHAYFRFDFDIGNFTNNIIESDFLQIHYNPITHQWEFKQIHTPLQFEQKKYRGLFNSYTFLEKGTDRGYRIIPGGDDGTASSDAYAKGDIWGLHYHGGEIDDGIVHLSGSVTEAQIDKFVNGESIDGADVVLWYGAHFTHNPSLTHGEKDFGPDLHPLNW